MRSHRKFTVLIVGLALLALACGGSKEQVVVSEPDPFPEPPPERPVERQPAVTNDEPEPVAKAPLRLETVYFEFDQSNLTPRASSTLAENARMLSEYPNAIIRIEGHCDERGTVEYNLALGERRARSVRNYLITYGINANRISIISYGKERPVELGHSEAAWARNRRAEFVILSE